MAWCRRVRLRTAGEQRSGSARGRRRTAATVLEKPSPKAARRATERAKRLRRMELHEGNLIFMQRKSAVQAELRRPDAGGFGKSCVLRPKGPARPNCPHRAGHGGHRGAKGHADPDHYHWN